MCDVYGAKCPFCNHVVCMHLGDFRTPRTEVEVLCHKHIKRVVHYADAHGYAIWTYKRYTWRKARKCAVVALTERAWLNREHNCPNEAETGSPDAECEAPL